MLKQVQMHCIFHALDTLEGFIATSNSDPAAIYEDTKILGIMNDALDSLIVQLKEIGLILSINKTESIKHALALCKETEARTVAVNIFFQFKELKERIAQESQNKAFYCISLHEAELIDKGADIFTSEVNNKFSDITIDLGEAAKCFGFSRYTACVFHLMRSMERVLQVIGEDLGVELKNTKGAYPAWGNIISNINEKLHDKPAERKKWSSVMDRLYYVKDAWRNNTMHPKETYTEEEAKNVLEAVKLLLQALVKI